MQERIFFIFQNIKTSLTQFKKRSKATEGLSLKFNFSFRFLLIIQKEILKEIRTDVRL